MRPSNWRRYCASPSPSPPTSILESGGGGGGSLLLEQCGALPPACILYVLCENGGGKEAGASELQTLIWQLLELTLRPEDRPAAGAGAAAQPMPPPVLGSMLLPRRGGGSADGARKTGAAAVVESKGSTGKQREGGEKSLPLAVAAGGGGGSAAGAGEVSAGVAEAEGGLPLAPPLQPLDPIRARSPAELLMAKGLVGSDALVEMAQDLLSPAACPEARKRTARVLRHLWAASAADSRPEVRTDKIERGRLGWRFFPCAKLVSKEKVGKQRVGSPVVYQPYQPMDGVFHLVLLFSVLGGVGGAGREGGGNDGIC